MIKGLEELKRMAYENACCRCQYYKDKECTNKGNCVWKTIEINLKALAILIYWYQPDIIHDLFCLGASDEEINLVREVLKE